MKTVEDAIEFYRGVFPEVNEDLGQVSEIVSPYPNGNIDTSKVGKFEVRCYADNGAHVIRSDYWQIVCTRKEFEDYAEMMELNKLNKEAVKIDVKHDAIRGEETVSYAMLQQLTLACENNTGNEPSLSCYHYALDKSKAFLDPRTDEEKLIDEVAKILKNTHNENLGLVKSPDLFNLNAKLIIQEVNKLK